LFFVALCTAALAGSLFGNAEEESPTKVLVVVGPSQHPPGTHEAAAGARLMEYCVNHAENIGPVEASLVDHWPSDAAMLKEVDTVVFIGDIFPPVRMENSDQIMSQLSKMMDRGCGMVCVHYATGLRAANVSEDGDHPLLRWIGGYFATGCPHHRSIARVCPATLVPEDVEHPVLRGWKEFHFDDEPYWNNYFGKNGMADNVSSLVYAMLPANAPKKETIVWAVEREDGGRGIGIVVPHFFRNWRIDDLRTLIMNSIAWTAKLEIPVEGVKTTLPADLSVFQPESVDPQPRKKKKR
jgi:type 1 glutamine amidotransferase